MRQVSLRALHSAIGLFPLGAYLLFHAWEHWPVRSGRDALFARLRHTQSAPLEIALVLLPLLAHALLGLRLAGRPDPERGYLSPAFRRLQLATGVVGAAFIGVHLIGVWLPRLTEVPPTAAAHSALLEQLGALPGTIFYLVGLAAICTHFGQGFGVSLGRLAQGRVKPEHARACGIALGVLLWLAFLNEVASYATHAPLL